MPKELTKTQQFYLLVQTTLHNDWDPIGIVELNGPEDEYYAYAEQVFLQIEQGWEAGRIADYLHNIATEYIGMKNTPYELSLKVAKKLSEASRQYLRQA